MYPDDVQIVVEEDEAEFGFEGEKPLLQNHSKRFGIKHVLSAEESQKFESITLSSTDENGQIVEEILNRKIQEYNDLNQHQNSPIHKFLLILGLKRFYSMCTDQITWLMFPLPRIQTTDGLTWTSCVKIDCIHLVRNIEGKGGFGYNVYFVKKFRILVSNSIPQRKINHFKGIQNLDLRRLRNPIATVAVDDGSPSVFVRGLVWLVIILILVAIGKASELF